jgi:hypothetical protein
MGKFTELHYDSWKKYFIQPFKVEAQAALFKDPVRTAQ